MINSKNLINDGLTNDCKNNGQNPWSYNQGVVLHGLVNMYKIKNNKMYLDEAENIAKAVLDKTNKLVTENNILHESCDNGDCGADGTQFKGIFQYNFSKLQ